MLSKAECWLGHGSHPLPPDPDDTTPEALIIHRRVEVLVEANTWFTAASVQPEMDCEFTPQL
jgi:hypothetical protein